LFAKESTASKKVANFFATPENLLFISFAGYLGVAGRCPADFGGHKGDLGRSLGSFGRHLGNPERYLPNLSGHLSAPSGCLGNPKDIVEALEDFL
jgi:hypothetical protein